MRVRIDVDRDVCVSAGYCVSVAAEVFDQDEDGIVELLVDPVPAAAEERAREAVRLCPASALRLARP